MGNIMGNIVGNIVGNILHQNKMKWNEMSLIPSWNEAHVTFIWGSFQLQMSLISFSIPIDKNSN